LIGTRASRLSPGSFAARFILWSSVSAALFSGCRRWEVSETFPQGNPKVEKAYGRFGARDSLHVKAVKTYFFNGRPESETEYRRGEKHGDAKEYWHNGQIKSEGEYRRGLRNGPWKFYWNRYQLSSQGEYVDGVKEGWWTEYYENGDLRKSGLFHRGDETGTWVSYGHQGAREWSSSCFAGNDTGSYRGYHENGQGSEKYACRRGKPVGLYEKWDEDGDLIQRGFYDRAGRRDSLWEEFYPEGGLASRASYRAGHYEDSLWRWTPEGKIRERGFFQEDSGELKAYHPDGKIHSIRIFRGDSLVAMTTYHPGGETANAGAYVGGLREGSWKRWDTLGLLREESNYHRGVLEGWQVFYDSLGNPTQRLRYEHGYPAEGRFRGIP